MNSIYLEYFISKTDQIIFTIDDDGLFEYVSHQWTNLLGNDTVDVIGQHYNCFTHPEDERRIFDYMSKVASAEKQNLKIEYRIKHLNGNWCWLEAHYTYIENIKNNSFQFLCSFTDITDKKQTENKLKNERLRLNLLVEYSSDIMFSTTNEGVFTYISNQKTNLGYEPNDLINRKYTEIIHEDFHQLLNQYHADKLLGKAIVDNLELLAKHKDGAYRWMLVKGNFIKFEENESPNFVGIAIDIHDQVLERNKIAKDLKVFESIFEETLGGYWEWNLKKSTLFLSNKLKKTIGYSASDYKYITTNPLMDVMDAEDYDVFWNETREFIKSNPTKPFKREIRFKHKLGHHLTMIICGIITERRGSNIEKVIGCLVDITEQSNIKNQLQKQNEELIQLRYTEQQSIKEAAYQVMLGQEHERNTIAQELHDGVNQLLFAAKIQIQESRYKNDKLHENGISLIEKSINEIKYIASSQNSFLLFNKSLYEGLNELIFSLPQNKIKFHLSVNNKLRIRISDNKRIIVLRIIQELIHNILKYSDGTAANIFVKKAPHNVSILVTDNGVGFDVLKTKKGNGFLNLENKLKVISGSYFIKSKKNTGTLVYINFPTKS